MKLWHFLIVYALVWMLGIGILLGIIWVAMNFIIAPALAG